jgi:hypothetical protein
MGWTANYKPSLIRTVPSAPEFHRIMQAVGLLAGFTAGREFHPAPKVRYLIVISNYN